MSALRDAGAGRPDSTVAQDEQTRLRGNAFERAAKKAAILAAVGTSQCCSPAFAAMLAQQGPQASSPTYINDLPTSRFSDIATAAATAVIAPDGHTVLAANRIALCGRDVAIASQYPCAADLQAYLGMLAVNRPCALVVLASDWDIYRSALPRYFSQAGVYGDVAVSVRAHDPDHGDGLTVRRYDMTISMPDRQDTVIPVLHASDWADHSSLPAAQMQRLALLVQSQKAAGLANPAAASVPVIHCRAGVGRTGQLIAAMMRDSAPALSLESLITEMRIQRNAYMVQTDAQLGTLVDMWMDKGLPIMSADAHAANDAAEDGMPRHATEAAKAVARKDVWEGRSQAQARSSLHRLAAGQSG